MSSSSYQAINNAKGQILVEYVLLLIIIIGLGWLFARSFFTPFKSFGSQVFTSTIACSLEYGKLPSDIRSEEGCDASYPGREVKGQLTGNGTGQGQNKNSNGKDGDKNGGRSKDGGKSKASERGGGGGASSGSISDGSGGGGSGWSPSSQPSLSHIEAPKGAKVVSPSSSDGGSSSEINYGSDGDSGGGYGMGRRRRLYRPIKGALAEVAETIKTKDKEKAFKRPVVTNSSGLSGEGKKTIFKSSTEGLKKKSAVKEEKLDLSGLIRLALIILMIVAIILFIFFQISQIRKNSE